MDEKQRNRRMRRYFGGMGIALLILRLLMEACVSGAMVIQLMVQIFSGQGLSEAELDQMLGGNGWGYVLCVALGLLLVLAWKGSKIYKAAFRRGNPMAVGSFFQLLALCLGLQLLCQLYAVLLELVLNQFGLTALDQLAQASARYDTVSMYLYACILAPVWEEFLFRGVFLRSMEPFGKRFAIFSSAFLFGMFHGNLIQIPFAFLLGLVLGYVAWEHGILWAMVLHMFNNLVLSDFLSRLPGNMGDGVLLGMLGISALASLGILIWKWPEIRKYFRENPLKHGRIFFTSPGILAFVAVMLLYVGLAWLG